jgi:hypothetical protein
MVILSIPLNGGEHRHGTHHPPKGGLKKDWKRCIFPFTRPLQMVILSIQGGGKEPPPKPNQGVLKWPIASR